MAKIRYRLKQPENAWKRKGFWAATVPPCALGVFIFLMSVVFHDEIMKMRQIDDPVFFRMMALVLMFTPFIIAYFSLKDVLKEVEESDSYSVFTAGNIALKYSTFLQIISGGIGLCITLLMLEPMQRVYLFDYFASHFFLWIFATLPLSFACAALFHHVALEPVIVSDEEPKT
ncbi:MAG: hypothetical protein ACPGVT_03310 [Maricaulaceae bacterium]